MTISTTTSPRPAVQTENTHDATAPQVSVVPVNTKIAEQRTRAGRYVERPLKYMDESSGKVSVRRWHTSDRSDALTLASEFVDQAIVGLSALDFSMYDEAALKLVIEGSYLALSEQMHAIKYKPNDSRGKSEFNDEFLRFEKSANKAMEQGEPSDYEEALHRLYAYLAHENSGGSRFDIDGDTEIDDLLSEIDNAKSGGVPGSVLQEAGPAYGTPAEVFHDPSAARKAAIPNEILGSAQFKWPLAPSEENNSAGIYDFPKKGPSEEDLETIDELIDSLKSVKKSQHSIHETEANPTEHDVRPNIGRSKSRLLDGNGKKKNDGKSRRRRDGDTQRSEAAKSPHTTEREAKPSGPPDSKVPTRESAKTKDLQELLADQALREAKATKSKVKATRSNYKRVLAQTASRKFTTGSKTELVKHAASSLKTLQKDPNAWFYPDTQLNYLATMDNVFDCWINLTEKEEAKSSLTRMKEAFIERSLPLLAENKFSEFSSLFRRELMLMMDDFGYGGEFVRVLDRKRGVLASSHVTKKDFAKEIKVIADEMHGRINLSGKYISNELSMAVSRGGKSDILTMYDRIFDNSNGQRRIQVGELRKQFFEFSNMCLLKSDHAGFSSLCQKHAIAVNKII
ncbi:hypothetical protein [Rhizobacter sp. SG703]|uniref:hypothetical protein n=1 Tax=Rhizobacter sp. SG703 TaxID=2587140 RepID=UPI0014472A1A|nr:hypothetical protein [Rhizobacter sp. SG703]NKI97385.1 hypothetical protein [Rhizobacter sp. SG703]